MFQYIKNYFKPTQNSTGNLEMATTKNLEKQIRRLEQENKKIQEQLDYCRTKEKRLQKILVNYDTLLKRVVVSSNETSQEGQKLANLETAFQELLERYEAARNAVKGLQHSEAQLKQQVAKYEDILDNVKINFVKYKSCNDENDETAQIIREKKPKPKPPSVHVNLDDKGKKRRFMTTL